MDSFMDKITRKLSSGDVIRANAEAEAKELKKSKERVEELEKTVSEMRRLSLKCAETNELTTQLIQGAIEKIEGPMSGSFSAEPADLSEIKEALEGSKEAVSEIVKEQEDFIHKENVRVYRNVQASIVDELKLQTEALAIQNARLDKKLKAAKTIGVWSLVINLVTFLGLAGAIAYYIIFIGI